MVVSTIAEMVVFWNDKITFEEKGGGLMSKWGLKSK